MDDIAINPNPALSMSADFLRMEINNTLDITSITTAIPP
jgi:hypothetical protein